MFTQHQFSIKLMLFFVVIQKGIIIETRERDFNQIFVYYHFQDMS